MTIWWYGSVVIAAFTCLWMHECYGGALLCMVMLTAASEHSNKTKKKEE